MHYVIGIFPYSLKPQYKVCRVLFIFPRIVL